MRTTQIGDLTVSAVGLGCNNFGRALDQEGSATVVNAALDAGVNFFDTSDNYGEGRSEKYLGVALGAARSEVVIATKFGMPVSGEEGSGGARPEYIRRAVERSLRQLNTDWIDLYQLHLPDPTTPIGDTIEVLADLVEAGIVRQIGCSNLDAVQLEEALDLAGESGRPPFVSDQVEYSLLHRDPESNGLLEVCGRKNVCLLPFYPLSNGLLTGKLRPGETPQGRLGMDRYQSYLTEENFAIVDRLRAFARDRGVEMVQVAIGWLLANPLVPSVTAGATSPDQVQGNAAAADWTLDQEDLDELASISSRVKAT